MRVNITLDVDVPRRARRVALYVGLPAVLLLLSGIVLAAVPNTFKPGDPLTSSSINANFTAVAPSGLISAFGGGVAPTGWLLCDGSAISRTKYPDLYLAIGTTFGPGDGSTTFNVPDLRGRFARGVDGDAGRDPDRDQAGAGLGSVQDDVFQSHTHTYTMTSLAQTAGLFVGANYNASFASATTSASGGSETRPKNLAVTFIIKL